MQKKIIGLTGPIASGKGTVKKYIEEKYGGKDCRFSTVMRDILDRLGIEKTRESVQQMSTILRQNFGQNILAKVIAKDIERLDSDLIVVDGVRRLTDIEYLKDLQGFVLVKIDADPKTRYDRMIKRNENKGDDKKTYEQFLKDHEADSDYEVPIVMSHASKALDNNGDLQNLYSQIDELLK
jgi:dephospho-CoA kinase